MLTKVIVYGILSNGRTRVEGNFGLLKRLTAWEVLDTKTTIGFAKKVPIIPGEKILISKGRIVYWLGVEKILSVHP